MDLFIGIIIGYLAGGIITSAFILNVVITRANTPEDKTDRATKDIKTSTQTTNEASEVYYYDSELDAPTHEPIRRKNKFKHKPVKHKKPK